MSLSVCLSLPLKSIALKDSSKTAYYVSNGIFNNVTVVGSSTPSWGYLPFSFVRSLSFLLLPSYSCEVQLGSLDERCNVPQRVRVEPCRQMFTPCISGHVCRYQVLINK